MMNQNEYDPVINEVRAARHRISERCNHDPAQLVAYYTKLQEHDADPPMDTTKATADEAQSAA